MRRTETITARTTKATPNPEDGNPAPSKTNALVSPANASRTVLRRARRGRSSAWIDDEALS